MHSIELVEYALDLAEQLGYEIRQEWLGGGGGGCELHGRRIFFLDLALPPADQLDQLIEALCREPRAAALPMSPQLRKLLKVRKTA